MGSIIVSAHQVHSYSLVYTHTHPHPSHPPMFTLTQSCSYPPIPQAQPLYTLCAMSKLCLAYSSLPIIPSLPLMSVFIAKGYLIPKTVYPLVSSKTNCSWAQGDLLGRALMPSFGIQGLLCFVKKCYGLYMLTAIFVIFFSYFFTALCGMWDLNFRIRIEPCSGSVVS